MKEYKITLWKFLMPSIKISLLLIFFLFLMLLLMLGIYYKNGYIPTFLLVITIVWFLLFSVPNLLLHINYYKNDRGKKLYIDFNRKKIIILKGGIEKNISFKDVVKVEKVGICPSISYTIDTIAAWKYFYFYRIKLKDGSFVTLTRFLIFNLEQLLPNFHYHCLPRRYPMIKIK